MARIVIVEDNVMNAKLFDAVLRKRGGFDVTVTEDATKLLDLARSGQVDLVVMDISLAGCVYEGTSVDGVRLTQLLKGDPQTQPIPVILATAHAMTGDRERLLGESGADDYFSKPILDQGALIRRINELIARKSGAQR